jgi:hypothetical protein
MYTLERKMSMRCRASMLPLPTLVDHPIASSQPPKYLDGAS